jgi:uncharacterized protein
MPRPRKYRRICCNPSAYYFKPRGIPIHELDEILLEHDELESLRLADLLAFSHEEAAKEMNISRATFGRIVEEARRKVADGILNGKAIRINEDKLFQTNKKRDRKMSDIEGNESTVNQGVQTRFTGKIAIATNDQRRVAGHLGKCRSFMIYEIDGEKIISNELRENVFTHHRMHQHQEHHDEGGGHSHTQLIEGLKDCKYLISSGGGWRVVEDLRQNNITTLFTSENLIEDAVNKFIKGDLRNEDDLTCSDNGH